MPNIIKEAKHPIFQGLALPGGKDSYFDHERGRYEWHKSGGYADNIKQKLFASLENNTSWKKIETTHNAVPDGSYMGSGTHYRNGEHVLSISSTYGPVAYDNHHSITISHKPENKNATTNP